jgi:hypothetical protein
MLGCKNLVLFHVLLIYVCIYLFTYAIIYSYTYIHILKKGSKGRFAQDLAAQIGCMVYGRPLGQGTKGVGAISRTGHGLRQPIDDGFSH